jgi:hypothetical protein
MPDQYGNYTFNVGNGVTLTVAEEEAGAIAPQMVADLAAAKARIVALEAALDRPKSNLLSDLKNERNLHREWQERALRAEAALEREHIKRLRAVGKAFTLWRERNNLMSQARKMVLAIFDAQTVLKAADKHMMEMEHKRINITLYHPALEWWKDATQ